ncbi:MAG: hypothetical protein M3Y33_06370 [Actinomycetota bacterium]|nr:hypothetical protein [Actinomycetota bacterium]
MALAAIAALALAACGGTPASSHAAKTPAATATTQKTLTCTELNSDGAVAAVVSDLRKQGRLEIAEGSGLSQAVKDDISWGAWTGSGTYAQALDSALADEENWADSNAPVSSHPGGSIDPGWPSSPPQLSSDASQFNNEGGVVSSNPSYSAPDWASFKQAVAALGTDCGF